MVFNNDRLKLKTLVIKKGMKTRIVAAAIIVGAISLTSCKKDYWCDCSTTVNGGSSILSSTELKDQTKRDAKDACQAIEDGKPNTACTL